MSGILNNKMIMIPLIVLIIGVFGYIVLDINGAQNTLTNAGEDMMDDILDAGEAVSGGFESAIEWMVSGVTYQIRSVQLLVTNALIGVSNSIINGINDLLGVSIPNQTYMK